MLVTPWCPTRKTEMFIEGGQPTEPCPIHLQQRTSAPGLGILSNLFGTRQIAAPPAPVIAPSPGTLPAAMPSAGAPAPAAAADSTSPPADETAKKKRGFWGRLFGGSGGGGAQAGGKDNPAKDSPKDADKTKNPKPNQ
jgi:hypothetical protein